MRLLFRGVQLKYINNLEDAHSLLIGNVVALYTSPTIFFTISKISEGNRLTITGLDQKGSITSGEVSPYCLYVPDLVSDLMLELSNLHVSIPSYEYVCNNEYYDNDGKALGDLQKREREILCRRAHEEALMLKLNLEQKIQQDVIAVPPSFNSELERVRVKFAEYKKKYPWDAAWNEVEDMDRDLDVKKE